MLHVKIRRAVERDCPRLYELRRRSILELATTGMTQEQARAWAEGKDLNGIKRKLDQSELWVAEIRGHVVGWLSIKRDYLDGLYTDPSHAGKGIGTLMLEFVERRALDLGFQTVRADASSNAEEWYVRRGYVPTAPKRPDASRPLKRDLRASGTLQRTPS